MNWSILLIRVTRVTKKQHYIIALAHHDQITI